MKLWKNNKLNEEYELPFVVIYQGFKKSKFYDWVVKGFWQMDRALRGYLTAGEPEGLQSTFEEDDYEDLFDYVIEQEDKNEMPYL